VRQARLGSELAHRGQIGSAIQALRLAIRIEPGFAEAHNNLANQYLALADYDAAERHYRLACQIKPDFHQARSNLLILSLYSGGSFHDEVLAGYRGWAERRFPKPVSLLAHDGIRPAHSRLRVGYVSADYHSRNPVPKFVVPLLRGHDRGGFEVFGYSNVSAPDAVTARVQACCDAWRDIHALTDDAAAELIHRDEIDILFDLGGHWSGNRLGVFARQPAPVQISYLGYPGATGLPHIQYRISDQWADLPGEPAPGLIRLPCSYFCFDPPPDAPRPDELCPCTRRGYVTLGSFNYRPKITPRVVAAWAAILRGLPHSRLLLHRHDLDAADIRDSLLTQFAAQGVDRARVVFEDSRTSLSAHLGLYRDVDLALDTFPYNGATSTCEALWMGVPVVTCAGATHASRVGASLLSAVGLDALVTSSESAYVRTATALAADPEALRRIRCGLRERMQASSLLKPAQFLVAFERALLHIWKQCQRNGSDGSSGANERTL
jgi:protein O-GlcNAc transferase